MKIKIIAFIVLLPTLILGNTLLDNLYKSELTKLTRDVNSMKGAIAHSKERAKRSPERPIYKSRITMYMGLLKQREEKLENFKSNFKNSPSTVYKDLYNKKRADLSGKIRVYDMRVKRGYGSRYQSSLDSTKKTLEDLDNAYKEYLASLKKNRVVKKSKTNNEIANTIKNIKTKPVNIKTQKIVPLNSIVNKNETDNKSTKSVKLQPVELKASNINTTATLNNVSVGEKAKADVGGVSIGIEEKE